MNSIHNNGKDDKALDQDLEELDLRYQSVESGGPPELLDQAILNRAHRAVEAKNSWLDIGWMHGLTTVALVVLTFSVVVSLRETGEFDPSSVTAKDRSSGSQKQQKKMEPEAELKAKDDAVQGGYLLEEIMVTGAGTQVKETQESDESRLGKRSSAPAAPAPIKQAPAEPASADQPLADQIQSNQDMREESSGNQPSSSQAARERAIQAQTGVQSSLKVEVPLGESNNVQAEKVLQDTTTTDHTSQPKASVAEHDLNDLDTGGPLDLSQQAEALDIIVKHKLEGNEIWKEELDAFVKSYPDFPLPDELKP
jgi:hypothetical protein